jgi:hypothetical protein
VFRLPRVQPHFSPFSRPILFILGNPPQFDQLPVQQQYMLHWTGLITSNKGQSKGSLFQSHHILLMDALDVSQSQSHTISH